MNSSIDEKEAARGFPAARIIDPFEFRFVVELCEAIERYVADATMQDRAHFRTGGQDLRHAVERMLYFALVNDRVLFAHLVALRLAREGPASRDLSEMAALIAPYLVNGVSLAGRRPPLSLRARLDRMAYRRLGREHVSVESTVDGRPNVLFLVIQPKFIRFFAPIADALSGRHAFLTIDDRTTYGELSAAGRVRAHIGIGPGAHDLFNRLVKIADREYRAAPFDHLAVRFNIIREGLARLRPDCIVVPEGNAPMYELVNRAAKSLAVPTICVQQGWSPIVHCGFRNMTYSGMCVWGKGFSDILASANPKQRFVTTGNHMLTHRRQNDRAARRAIGFFLQKNTNLITEAAWSLILQLIQWAAERFPAAEVRVREHPGEPLSPGELASIEGYQNVRMMPSGVATLDETLDGCRVAVAVYSTTLLEAAASGAIPLILNVAGFPHYFPNIAAEGAAVEVNGFDEAKMELVRLMSHDAYCTSFAVALDRVRRRFFAHDRDEALARIVNEIQVSRPKWRTRWA